MRLVSPPKPIYFAVLGELGDRRLQTKPPVTKIRHQPYISTCADLGNVLTYGMITGHLKKNLSVARSLAFSRFYPSLLLVLGLVLVSLASLCAQSPSTANKSSLGTIVSQGRLQPTKGILKLSGIPADRIEKVLVDPGANVNLGDPMLVFESARLKKLELEVAELKLNESRSLYQTALTEAKLAVEAANLKLRSAQQTLKQAQANLELVSQQTLILRSLDDQLQSLQTIRNNPRLRGAVGVLELEAKRNQKISAQAEYERTLLGANQSLESATDLVAQAQSVVQSALQAQADLEANPSYRLLEKQVELIQTQLELSTLAAPSQGTVLQVSAIAGERSSTTPLVELADLTQMSCVAEVHEADVGQVRVGQKAEIKSASLSRTLRGKVSRIDRVVGSPVFRSPNPLARSDFRSVAVWIQIDPEDTPIAAERVHLQVEVSITP